MTKVVSYSVAVTLEDREIRRFEVFLPRPTRVQFAGLMRSHHAFPLFDKIDCLGWMECLPGTVVIHNALIVLSCDADGFYESEDGSYTSFPGAISVEGPLPDGLCHTVVELVGKLAFTTSGTDDEMLFVPDRYPQLTFRSPFSKE